ncbi:hypothetical protein [Lewinella sp. 4G2]|uniref:hypothetical protein n=1 Tax=Lewinella sp. 4G2 TaxID=1803372 RepID=UPI0007B4AA99|nr:hypothetical protein [Lewinella sp. 4G2]OAV45021.1 hypothetical protein A3850_011220 [Lewinella sp. 4G2]
MNRTFLLLLAVLVLGGITYFALRSDDTETSLADKAESRQFSYANVEAIDRIFIADRNGHQVNLTRGGVSGWLADGEPANANIVKGILHVVRGLDIQSLPSYKAIPNIIEDIATSGILVQLFDESGQKLQGYYLGGSNNDELGTYAIKEGVEDPYVVHLPGFTGNIRQRFMHWDDEWRDKVYWRVDPDKVTEFKIDYPKQQGASFKLTKMEDRFQLAPLYEGPQQTRMIPKGGVEGVLSRYEEYYISSFENKDLKVIERANNQVPFAIISITQEGQKPQTMAVYPRYSDDPLSGDSREGELQINSGSVSAYSAFINGGEDWVLLHANTMQPLLVGYDYF